LEPKFSEIPILEEDEKNRPHRKRRRQDIGFELNVEILLLQKCQNIPLGAVF
jgi:hypothetical protein